MMGRGGPFLAITFGLLTNHPECHISVPTTSFHLPPNALLFDLTAVASSYYFGLGLAPKSLSR